MVLDVQKKIEYVGKLAVLGFLALMAYSPKLWITEKDFPVIPRFDFIPIPSYPFDYILVFTLISLLVIFFFKQKKIVGLSITILYFYLAMVDQNRLQPYFYQSILSIFFISFYKNDSKSKTIVLHSLMLLFLATYFFSGIHKINENFNSVWMHAFSKHFGFLPEIVRYLFTRSVPFIEAIIALFLLFNKTRKIGVIGIVTMHLGIVTLLLVFGYGFNVIPWNLQNILSVILLFWQYKSENALELFSKYFNYKKAIVILLVFLLPFSNLVGFWDHLLSFSFFSAKLNYYYIEINDEDLLTNLPENVKKQIYTFEGKNIINFNDWAGIVNGVLFYPEDRVAYKTQKYIESFSTKTNNENLTKLVEYHHRKVR